MTAPVSATTIYDEDVQGDLSNNYQVPTQVNLLPGANSLFALVGTTTAADRSDYIAVSLPAGHQLSQLLMMDYASADGKAFIAVQDGSAFTFADVDAFANAANMRGYTHFGPAPPLEHANGDDILPDMGQNSQGFTPPLTGTAYTFWIQQTGADTAYQLDFIVTAIPEPGTAAMLLPVMACVGLARRRPFRSLRGRV
jgi:hypothetical protein